MHEVHISDGQALQFNSVQSIHKNHIFIKIIDLMNKLI